MITDYIKGLHHVTATVNDAREDYDFYTRTLGLRLVKKTVNFDNNQVYHFYYGTEVGTPGTIMTTFPYKGHGVRDGIIGTGQVHTTSFSVPSGSLDYWAQRLSEVDVKTSPKTRFGFETLQFQDPSGLNLELVANEEDSRAPWGVGGIPLQYAIRGFFTAIMAIEEIGPTLDFLKSVFGLAKVGQEGPITRLAAQGGGAGNYVDVWSAPEMEKGLNGLGTVHHLAWRIESEAEQLELRQHLVETLGMKVTEVKDRKYFRSIYFRIPGGVLFEVATIPPGFTVDESKEELGLDLKLPPWEEPHRQQIEQVLPQIP